MGEVEENKGLKATEISRVGAYTFFSEIGFFDQKLMCGLPL